MADLYGVLGLLRSKRLKIGMDIWNIGGLATYIKKPHKGLGIHCARERSHAGITNPIWRLLSSTAIWPSSRKKSTKGLAIQFDGRMIYLYQGSLVLGPSPLSCLGEGNEHYGEGVSTLSVDARVS